MYSAESLLEFCRRAHQSFEKLLVHCRRLTGEEFNREFDGFGYPTVKLQLHHALGAQKYWVGVLQGRMDVDDDPGDRFTIDDMMKYRGSVLELAEQYLSTARPEELATARPMTPWGNVEKNLIPAHVVMRTITHLYHHFGQAAAMCRALRKPIEPGMDYPIVP